MRKNLQRATSAALLASCITGAALACATPPEPPPPPSDPPIVCCMPITHFVDPNDPTTECIIIRYWRRDGLPLYQSNPMALDPSQQCIVMYPLLDPKAVQNGAVLEATTFGTSGIPGEPPLPWQGLPPDIPPYGPFEPIDEPATAQQLGAFLDAYMQAAGPDVSSNDRSNHLIPNGVGIAGFAPPAPTPQCACDFNGNGIYDASEQQQFQDCFLNGTNCPPGGIADCNGDGMINFADNTYLLSNQGLPCPVAALGTGGFEIQPGLIFDIYQKIRVPRGFDPNCLCVPDTVGLIGLFLNDNGTLLLEPGQPGAGIPIMAYDPFMGDPGAFYKFRWYRAVLPPVCPPPCTFDPNGSGRADFGDITAILGRWLEPCPQ